MRFADIRTEWRVDAIETSLRQKAESHELHSINSDVHRLECSLRESRSETSELRAQLQELQENIGVITKRLEEVEQSTLSRKF